jgi:hypothetical protein
MPTTTATSLHPGTRARWLAAGLATGLFIAAIAAPAFVPRTILGTDPTTPPPEHTISVTGTGSVVLSPDIADVRVGVSITKPTVKAARAAAAESMSRVLAALKKLGIADRDLQTTILSLQPVYDYSTDGNPPRLTGYLLTNSVAVTVRDLDKVGDVVDDAMTAGATSLDGVTFRVDDPAKAEEQARQEAIVQAKAKAETLAKGVGVSIGGVASISETSAPIPYPYYYGGDAAAAGGKSVPTPVQPGMNEVSVTVAVTFLIK